MGFARPPSRKVVLSAFPKGTRSVTWQGSNPGPLGSEPNALPLSHTTPPTHVNPHRLSPESYHWDNINGILAGRGLTLVDAGCSHPGRRCRHDSRTILREGRGTPSEL
ncbi:hypothetical protein Bbelb_087790 [Branchiostoma belcheri]|nr:hypothetical protein Bbelb_087790 [Branchiostoma belcheri]